MSVRGQVDLAVLDEIAMRSEVPVWLVDPVPAGWQLSGLAFVGDPRERIRATVSSYTGPAPLGGDGEWLIVAEESGIGLGGAYAGSSATVGSSQLGSAAPAKVQAGGRPTSLWVAADAADHLSAYVGEAQGVWIWMIGFPADAGYAVLENLALSDAREQRPAGLSGGASSAHLRPGR